MSHGPALPAPFLTAPLAHRGLHQKDSGCVENSLSAIKAAIDAGYSVEIDAQMSRDGQAIVFHDDRLERLTNLGGRVLDYDAGQLLGLRLRGSPDHIATLPQVLTLIAGQGSLLIEIKDQTGVLGPSDGRLEHAVYEALRNYQGPVALMSFNPHAVSHMAKLCPQIPRGLTTDSFSPDEWPEVPKTRADHLRQIADYHDCSASFISHHWTDLAAPPVEKIRASGGKILCWTIRNQSEATAVMGLADNITFENYRPSVSK